jgi:hypothetical protein
MLGAATATAAISSGAAGGITGLELSIPTDIAAGSGAPIGYWLDSADWLFPSELQASLGTCPNNTALALEDVVLVVTKLSLRLVQAAVCDLLGADGIQQVTA